MFESVNSSQESICPKQVSAPSGDWSLPLTFSREVSASAIYCLNSDWVRCRLSKQYGNEIPVIGRSKASLSLVVQLYVGDMVSTVCQPVRELKGFEKVALAPGETKTVTFTLDKRAFAYYEPKCGDWYVESGEFVIEIGQSSRNICLNASVQVEGTTALAFTVTENTTIGQLMKHSKGAALIAKMLPDDSTANTAAMGEGSEKIMQNMMFEMSLGALVSYGRMSREQLTGLIAMLNS